MLISYTQVKDKSYFSWLRVRIEFPMFSDVEAMPLIKASVARPQKSVIAFLYSGNGATLIALG